jgi:hypothetical protein
MQVGLTLLFCFETGELRYFAEGSVNFTIFLSSESTLLLAAGCVNSAIFMWVGLTFAEAFVNSLNFCCR